MVVFNLSFLVKYITRFTEDCFSAMVAIVFIIDAIRSLYNLKTIEMSKANSTNTTMNGTSPYPLDKNPIFLNAQNESKFYFSCILFVFTFLMCVGLKNFQNKPYLPSKVNHSYICDIYLRIFQSFYLFIRFATSSATLPFLFRSPLLR